MANPEENNKISAAAIGERLRQAREKRSITVEQAQKQTRIHSTVITALEEGRCDDILTPNYVKSFLKEYANYLGFDSREMVTEYLALHPELQTKNVSLAKTVLNEPIDLSILIRAARFILIFAIMIFLAFFLVGKTKDMLRQRNIIKKELASRRDRPKAAASVSSKAALPQARKGQGSRKEPFTLTLKVKSPTMIQLKRDGVVIFKRVLSKGTVETFTANNSVNMFVARAEAIEILVNGKSQGVPGRGVIRDLEVTSNGVRVK